MLLLSSRGLNPVPNSTVRYLTTACHSALDLMPLLPYKHIRTHMYTHTHTQTGHPHPPHTASSIITVHPREEHLPQSRSHIYTPLSTELLVLTALLSGRETSMASDKCMVLGTGYHSTRRIVSSVLNILMVPLPPSSPALECR